VLYGMGPERVVPGVFRKVHPGRRTPIAAILFSTGVAMALILTGDTSRRSPTPP
jgi:amino acid transporter